MYEASERLAFLWDRYVQNTCSRQEFNELLQQIELFPEETLQAVCYPYWEQAAGAKGIPQAGQKLQEMLVASRDKQASIDTQINPVPVHRIHFLRTAWFRYAAAIILLFGSVAYFWIINKKTEQTLANVNKSLQADIEPGTNKAILTLADGSTIILDNAANGKLAQQGNAQVIKLSNGEIAYNLKGVAEGEVMMNTMSTPRGGQYQLTLPDGSKIWLNAASSITYPAVFVGAARKIKITGEAYFEIAKNKQQPFIVDVDGKSLIEVLGTSFNVNSYADENTIKTTLVEGSVKVKVGNAASLLKPNQGAEVMQSSNVIKISDNVNIDQTLAWKNGIFDFNNADLQTVMRQLARWYDIEVRYEGTIPDKSFEGELSRDVMLSAVLNWFSKLGIQNRLEGRTLILSTNH